MLLHRSWFNTFTMGPLVVGLLAGQAAVLALWALLLWGVVLSRWVEMRVVSCHVSTLARWVVDVDYSVVWWWRWWWCSSLSYGALAVLLVAFLFPALELLVMVSRPHTIQSAGQWNRRPGRSGCVP